MAKRRRRRLPARITPKSKAHTLQNAARAAGGIFVGSGLITSPMIDINTATAAEIDAIAPLKGHGFEIARYRQERDGFTELRPLDEVPHAFWPVVGEAHARQMDRQTRLARGRAVQ